MPASIVIVAAAPFCVTTTEFCYLHSLIVLLISRRSDSILVAATAAVRHRAVMAWESWSQTAEYETSERKKKNLEELSVVFSP